jgi:sugar (pentulose or hexulose) kinase
MDVLQEVGALAGDGSVHTAGPFGDDQPFGQVRADLYGRDVVRHGDGVAATSLAAMIIASCAIEESDPYQMASRLLKRKWECAPRPGAGSTYEAAYRRYLRAATLLCEFDQGDGRDERRGQ